MFNYFAPALASIAVMSCGTSGQDGDYYVSTLYEIDYSRNNSGDVISSIVDSVEFIPLYGSIENPIAHVDELQMTKNGIYILDKRRNQLHVYGNDGNRRFTLQAKGHANEEYLEIACFAVKDSSVFVVDNYGKKINEYSSYNGCFKSSHPVAIVVGAVRPLMSGGFMLAELPLEGVTRLDGSEDRRIYITDDSFRIKSSAYPYGDQRDKIGMGRYFSGNDSVIIYSSVGYNGFTKISVRDGGIIGNVAINTDMPFDNTELAGMDINAAFDIVEQKQWQFLTTAPLVAGRYICLSVRDNEATGPSIYDENTGKLYFNDVKSMRDNLIAPDDAYGDSYYVVYNFGGEFLDEQLKLGFNRPSSVVDSIIRNDGAALLRYKMVID